MSLHQLQDIAHEYFVALNTPVSLSMAILLREGEWDQIVNKTTDPAHYLTSASYAADACATSFLRKLETAPSTIDKKAVAFEKWESAEKQCFRANRLINAVLDGQTPSTNLLEVFSGIRKNIHQLIGRPSRELEPKLGKGSTFAIKGDRRLIPDKLSKVPEMTNSAWIFLQHFSKTAWARNCSRNLFSDDPSVAIDFPSVRGNRWWHVPKDARTDRSIAIEPTLNGFYQLGIGSQMRVALNRQGFLLNDSQELHRRLARKGSIDDSLATIDLSNASDTISYALVRAVLPHEWFHLVDACRSPMTKLPDGSWRRLEKFSSMGNGYTFELETTIFAAICMYSAEYAGISLRVGENFSVYGDDIIIPKELYPYVSIALRGLFFTLNEEKSFPYGPFKESCGGDYFDGNDVRPIFIKQEPVTPADYFTLHNMLVRSPAPVCLEGVLTKVLDCIPSHLRSLTGPEELGDIVLHSLRTPWQTRIRTHRVPDHNDWGPWERRIRVLLPQVQKIPLCRWDDCTAVTSSLYGVPSEGQAPRGAPEGYRIAWVALP